MFVSYHDIYDVINNNNETKIEFMYELHFVSDAFLYIVD